jgi:hypothetical protein
MTTINFLILSVPASELNLTNDGSGSGAGVPAASPDRPVIPEKLTHRCAAAN